MGVIGIAVVQAIPVFLAGVLTRNKAILTIAAIIMSLISAVTGKPAYLFVDLLFIWAAFVLAWLGIA